MWKRTRRHLFGDAHSPATMIERGEQSTLPDGRSWFVLSAFIGLVACCHAKETSGLGWVIVCASCVPCCFEASVVCHTVTVTVVASQAIGWSRVRGWFLFYFPFSSASDRERARESAPQIETERKIEGKCVGIVHVHVMHVFCYPLRALPHMAPRRAQVGHHY